MSDMISSNNSFRLCFRMYSFADVSRDSVAAPVLLRAPMPCFYFYPYGLTATLRTLQSAFVKNKNDDKECNAKRSSAGENEI